MRCRARGIYALSIQRSRVQFPSSPPFKPNQSARCQQTARFALSRSRLEAPSSLVQPDLLVEDLELGLVDVVLHPRLGDLKEGRAGDHVPVEPVGRELLELLGDGDRKSTRLNSSHPSIS